MAVRNISKLQSRATVGKPAKEPACGLEARPTGSGLALTLTLCQLLHFAFLRSARDVGGPLRLGRGRFALGALQFLLFGFVFDVFRVHSILIPAYFATSFFNPYPGKLTVT